MANDGDELWRLEFELRGTTAHTAATVTESLPARFDEARAVVERVFGNKPLPVGSKEVKQLGRTLEKTIGPREEWRLPLLRDLWSALYAGAGRRRRSADHERVFFQLAGYSLRPGFGYPLDEWRCEQTFLLFGGSVTFHAEQPIWSEFWVMWRRLAGGLAECRRAIPHLGNTRTAQFQQIFPRKFWLAEKLFDQPHPHPAAQRRVADGQDQIENPDHPGLPYGLAA